MLCKGSLHGFIKRNCFQKVDDVTLQPSRTITIFYQSAHFYYLRRSDWFVLVGTRRTCVPIKYSPCVHTIEVMIYLKE
jgi:hypothetical protein